MTVAVGDRLPEAGFVVMGRDGPEVKTTSQIFQNRRVALFGVPGAYTPVCHSEHLPGIVSLHDSLQQHGVDAVACTSTNDIFVMDRWSIELGAVEKVLMLADGNADFAIKTGLAVDLRKFGLGYRSNRYAMLVSNGIVRVLNVEDVLMKHDKASAEKLCENLEQAMA
jgi:glutaredoxin/glutathione-dependent peroxiredoxin